MDSTPPHRAQRSLYNDVRYRSARVPRTVDPVARRAHVAAAARAVIARDGLDAPACVGSRPRPAAPRPWSRITSRDKQSPARGRGGGRLRRGRRADDHPPRGGPGGLATLRAYCSKPCRWTLSARPSPGCGWRSGRWPSRARRCARCRATGTGSGGSWSRGCSPRPSSGVRCAADLVRGARRAADVPGGRCADAGHPGSQARLPPARQVQLLRLRSCIAWPRSVRAVAGGALRPEATRCKRSGPVGSSTRHASGSRPPVGTPGVGVERVRVQARFARRALRRSGRRRRTGGPPCAGRLRVVAGQLARAATGEQPLPTPAPSGSRSAGSPARAVRVVSFAGQRGGRLAEWNAVHAGLALLLRALELLPAVLLVVRASSDPARRRRRRAGAGGPAWRPGRRRRRRCRNAGTVGAGCLGRDPGVEQHLQQHVAELLAHRRHASPSSIASSSS